MNFRLAADLREGLDSAIAADPDSLSRSEYLRRLLTDHLREKGYLKP